MQFPRIVMVAVLACLLAMTGAARADTTVELKGVHLCCGMCVKAVGGILKEAGVKGKCDQDAKTVTITASDDKAAQKALDALAAKGFHGDSGNKNIAMKDDSGATAGKVQKVTISGIHNCCGQCCKGIKAICAKVSGVSGDTAKPKLETFDITGDFDPVELVKALNAAGFHCKVTK